jgi:hypothetical protein
MPWLAHRSPAPAVSLKCGAIRKTRRDAALEWRVIWSIGMRMTAEPYNYTAQPFGGKEDDPDRRCRQGRAAVPVCRFQLMT